VKYAVLLVLVLEVGHSLIPSSRTRNSSGSKRSTKRVNIAAIRASSSLAGQTRSVFVIRLATEASKHAAQVLGRTTKALKQTLRVSLRA
jgi:hypothetical protein